MAQFHWCNTSVTIGAINCIYLLMEGNVRTVSVFLGQCFSTAFLAA